MRIIRVSVSRGLQKKKSYEQKTYYFTDRKAGLTMYESPSVYGVHPFVRLTFLPSIQSIRPSVPPSVQSSGPFLESLDY